MIQESVKHEGLNSGGVISKVFPHIRLNISILSLRAIYSLLQQHIIYILCLEIVLAPLRLFE